MIDLDKIKEIFSKIEFISDRDWGGDRFHSKEYIIPILFGLLNVYILLEQRSCYKWKVFITLYLFGRFSIFDFNCSVQDMPVDEVVFGYKMPDEISLGFINGKEAKAPLVKLIKHL